MTTEEILQLGRMARVEMSPEQAEHMNTDIAAILEYVSRINKIVGDTPNLKQVGPVYNVFRDDAVTNTPDQYTDSLIAAMPESSGRYMRVPKILTTDSD